jgi:hypothetical protein
MMLHGFIFFFFNEVNYIQNYIKPTKLMMFYFINHITPLDLVGGLKIGSSELLKKGADVHVDMAFL